MNCVSGKEWLVIIFLVTPTRTMWMRGSYLWREFSITWKTWANYLILEHVDCKILHFFLYPQTTLRVNKTRLLTCPPPLSLLVSFTLLKDTAVFIQCAPKFGESGWMYTQLGVWGSGCPPGTHSPFTYFHLWLSADTKSSKIEYIAFGSKPETLILSTGNMRLGTKKRIHA